MATAAAHAAGSVEIAGIRKVYDGDVLAVDGINLKVEGGSYCCLLGPSGCGKSTILRMIAGHEMPSDGEILLDGEDVVGLPPLQRRTAMMFQSYALFPHLTVRDNVAFALRVRGLTKADRYRRADEMMEKVRISELAERLPAQLSGGQQQRVALARAAITEPKVLLLDEPLSALDEQLRIQMRQELSSMQRDLGITFIHVTHTQLEAIALADLVVVMANGKIKQAGPPREIYNQPHDRYVAEFLGGQNVLSGRVDLLEDNAIVITSPEIKTMRVVRPARRSVQLGDRVDVAVRRDQVRLLRPGYGVEADLTTVASRVQSIEYQGSFVKVMLDQQGKDEFLAFVPESAFFQDPFAVGDVVLAGWQASDARLLAS